MKKAYLFAYSLFLSGVVCLVVFSAIGSYVADDGTLVEEFWLAPIGFILAILGLGAGMIASAHAMRRKPERMDKWMFGISFGVALFSLVYFTASYSHITNTVEQDASISDPVETTDVSVVYSDGEKSVSATYRVAEQTVSFTHPEVGTQILPVAVSASGARYANLDESVVFWEHQDEVTIMRNGEEIFRGRIKKDAEIALTELEARSIAEQSCVKGGEALSVGMYNSISKTWWFDANLNTAREGCNPACVVTEETKTAEINWRCTGLTPPKNPGVSEVCGIENCHGLEILCGSNPVEMCTEIYQLGDKCRQFAQCGVVNGTCQLIEDPRFIACKACVQECERGYVDEPERVFFCESECGA